MTITLEETAHDAVEFEMETLTLKQLGEFTIEAGCSGCHRCSVGPPVDA